MVEWQGITQLVIQRVIARAKVHEQVIQVRCGTDDELIIPLRRQCRKQQVRRLGTDRHHVAVTATPVSAITSKVSAVEVGRYFDASVIEQDQAGFLRRTQASPAITREKTD